MPNTTFAQLVVSAQRFADIITDEIIALVPDKDERAEAVACKAVITEFTNYEALPNDEAATIGGLFAKIAALRAAKDADGQAFRAEEIAHADTKKALEVAQEQLRLKTASATADTVEADAVK